MNNEHFQTNADEPDATDTYNRAFREGRQSALGGADRNMNRYFARRSNSEGVEESHELWQNKYDSWRQGWEDGRTTFEQEHGITAALEQPKPLPHGSSGG